MTDIDTRVTVTGETSDAVQSFEELATAARKADGAVAGVGSSSQTAAKGTNTFVHGLDKVTKKAQESESKLKKAGRSYGSSIGSIGGEALASAGNMGMLGAAVSALPLGPVAGTAAALGAAFLLLRDRESAAEKMARRHAEARERVKAAMEGNMTAANRLHDIEGELLQAQLDQKDSGREIAAARRKLAEIEKGAAQGSNTYAVAAREVVKADQANTASAVALQRARSSQAKALKDSGSNSLAYREASVRVTAAEQRATETARELAAARRKMADVTKGGGKNTRAYKETLIELNQAEARNRDARQKQLSLGQEAITNSKQLTKGFKDEIQALKQRRQQLALVTSSWGAMGRSEKDLATDRKELAKIDRQIMQKERELAGQHTKTAGATRDVAGAMSSAKGEGKYLRDEITELAGTHLDLSKQAAMLGALAGAAAGAAAALSGVAGAMAAASSAPGPSSRVPSGGGGGKRTNSVMTTNARALMAGGRSLIDRNRGRYTRRTTEERVRDDLTALGRNDSLQDKQARQSAEAAARGRGETSEQIRLRGDQAVVERQRRENRQRQTVVRRGIRQVRAAIAKALRTRDRVNADLRKSKKGSAAWKKNQEALERVRERLGDLYGQESGLISEAADLIAEANELGFDSAALRTEIERAPASEQGSSPGDLAAALAQLTPGTADDTAAAALQRSEAEAEFAAAQASGDRDRIISAANRLTEVSRPGGGSGGLQVNQFFPQGMPLDSPQILQAAAVQQLRITQLAGA